LLPLGTGGFERNLLPVTTILPWAYMLSGKAVKAVPKKMEQKEKRI
jgi:hypothetical protein